MSIDRCPECGSWGEQCANPGPTGGCGCARCLSAENAKLRALLRMARGFVGGDRGQTATRLMPLIEAALRRDINWMRE